MEAKHVTSSVEGKNDESESSESKNDEESSRTLPDKPSKKTRKKVPHRKRFNRPKIRGRHKKEHTASPALFLADEDLAECIYSDDEERAQFLQGAQTISESHLDYCLDYPDLTKEPLTSLQARVTSPLAIPGSSKSSGSQFSESSSLQRSVSVGSGEQSKVLLIRDGSSEGFIGLQSTKASSDETSSPTVPQAVHPPELSTSAMEHQGTPLPSLIERCLSTFRTTLHPSWTPTASSTGFHLVLLSPRFPRAIQREVHISYEGCVSIAVHCFPPPCASEILRSTAPIMLRENTIEEFCNMGCSIVKKIMQYDICIGANLLEAKSVWGNVKDSYIDQNPYREDRYTETCRSLSCQRLVLLGKQRCSNCTRLLKNLKRRSKSLLSENVDSNTPNIFLSHKQALEKLQRQHAEIRKKDKRISYLENKMQHILEEEGVELDEDISDDLTGLLSEADLSPIQRIFLEEQLKCVGKSDMRGHRWHPTMIRLALHLHMVSTSGYEALRDSEAIRLPSSRTLFNYSHVYDPQEGVSDGILKVASEKIAELEKRHQKFVALLMDEMHISQNLVYRQSDGSLIGYAHLDEVDTEVARFEEHINGNESPAVHVHLANKVLAYMIKGLTSGVKYVVAAYPCTQLTKDMLYTRTWDVISRLEKTGVKVLTVVSDGCSVNRAFVDMHTPITKVSSGVVYDTVNFCSSERRPLYFIADVAHLLKTIRNCFYNSGEGKKKTRCLQYNGQKIQWKTIVRLYLTFKQCNFRKSYKLNSQNVFPNAFSCMRVRYAAQILSNTVAEDIEEQGWLETEETVRFIRYCDKFFDCLNGAHSSQHIVQRKPNLGPYTCEDDARFQWLLSFLDYLEDWKKQSKRANLPPKDQEKTMLSYQTQIGIEMAIRGFIEATKFLLREGADFVMARVFSQDPLEHYFSMQRAGTGGSRNPNYSQFASRQVSLTVQRDLGIRVRKGNVEEISRGIQVTDEPLQKRKKLPTKK